MIDEKSTHRAAAIFLDRDGTLIEDVGTLANADDLRLFPDTIPALLKLQEKYTLFVITNQAAVAKGELTATQVAEVNQGLDALLAKAGVVIREWYVCPHQRKDGCSCIKPNPEFVLRAEQKYNLDLNRSFVIGDHPHDVYTADEQGVFGLYLLTGHGGKHLSELAQDKLVFHRISDAAEWISAHADHKNNIAQRIDQGARAIQNGGVAAFPTETVYGLGADVFQPDAVAQIFKIKGRPEWNPLIAHIADTTQMDLLAESVPDNARRLMDAFWPGPLTLVLPKRDAVPEIVTGGLPTVAIRMPAQPIALEFIRRCGTPVAAPSANRFSCTSPTTAQHVITQLGAQCPIVIDGGACRVGVESTVISFAAEAPVMLRPGGIFIEEIEKKIGDVETLAAPVEKSDSPASPGMLRNHYAPATKLSAYDKIPAEYANRSDVGVLLFSPSEKSYSGPVETLSGSGDPKEAAVNFFAALQRLDLRNLSEIVAEYAPDQGLGRAINNRLSKAANGRIDHHE
ncbi:MAG: threonylcarbamoyl-AMP synthase [Deltaproteobacteria bacterium]|nr:threonylcarbamoyl-AMP synthase [Deltaproteobacteria bacterium]MBN2672196.1 threonylcarbamoyl-AMP synthase [Deltaproteobacteria bacterium]